MLSVYWCKVLCSAIAQSSSVFIYVIFEHITLPYSHSFSRYSGVCFDFQWKETSCLCVLHQLYSTYMNQIHNYNDFNRILFKNLHILWMFTENTFKSSPRVEVNLFTFFRRCVQCDTRNYLGVRWMDHFHKVSVGLNDFFFWLFYLFLKINYLTSYYLWNVR